MTDRFCPECGSQWLNIKDGFLMPHCKCGYDDMNDDNNPVIYSHMSIDHVPIAVTRLAALVEAGIILLADIEALAYHGEDFNMSYHMFKPNFDVFEVALDAAKENI